jgi:hypothetical protein
MKFLRVLAVLAIVLCLLGGTAYFLREEAVNWWLARRLAGELSERLGAKVEMEGLVYRDGMLRANRCRVAGERMPFASLEIKKASVPFDWERLNNPGNEPLRIEVETVDLVWRDQPARRQSSAAAPGGAPGPELPPVEMSVENFSLRHEDPARWRVAETTARFGFEDGRWKFAATGGRLAVPGWPEFGLKQIAGEHHGNETLITGFALKETRGGSIEGSAGARDEKWSGQFRWQDVGMDLMLPPGAAKHLVGRSSGEANLSGGVFTGRMRVEGSEVRNLPALVKLASIFDGENYDNVPWETLEFGFLRDERGAVLVSDLVAVSSKGLALRGSGAVAPDYLSADLQLGLLREGRPWLVGFIPVLFREEKEGYLWTSVKVGGSPEAPTEDLTTRVVAALAAAPAAEVVDTAVEIPVSAIEAAGGLLRGLLGQ